MPSFRSRLFLTLLSSLMWFSAGVVHAQQDDGIAENSRAIREADRLIERYEEQLRELRNQQDTVAIIDSGRIRVTLHQLKVPMLDSRLSELRKQMTDLRLEKQSIDKETSKEGVAPEKLAWDLRQNQPVPDTEVDGQQLDARETIRRHQLWLETRITQLDALYLAVNEEFKFHYEKSRRLEIIDRRIQRIRKELAKLREDRYRILIMESIAGGLSERKQNQIIGKHFLNALKNYAREAEEAKVIEQDRAIVATSDITPLLTLHQKKVWELDSQLELLRRKMTHVRIWVDYVKRTLKNGKEEDFALSVWILIQEDILNPLAASDRQLSAREILEHVEYKLQRESDKLDEHYLALNEEFKFHFEKAVVNSLQKLRLDWFANQVELIGKYLPEDRRRKLELEAKVQLPPKNDAINEADEQRLTRLLKQILSNPDKVETDAHDKLEQWFKNVGPQSNSFKKSDVDNSKRWP